jgi:sugar lactone lactonase YvrE
MKRILLIVIFCSFVGGAYAETFTNKEVLRVKWGSGDGQIGLFFGGPEPSYEFPKDMTIDSKGNIYISDYVNKRIVKYNKNGAFIVNIGTEQSVGRSETYYENLCVDGDDNIYSFDGHNREIVKFNPSAQKINVIPESGDTGILMNVTKKGNIYVENYLKQRKYVKKQSMGIFGFGAKEEYASIDSSFAYESPNGDVYSFHNGNSKTIFKRDKKSSADQTTSNSFDNNGDNVDSSFNANKGDCFIGFDNQGNYYVSDINYLTIRKYNASGNLLVNPNLPKNPGIEGYTFRLVKVDSKGNIYCFLYDDKEAWIVKMEKI